MSACMIAYTVIGVLKTSMCGYSGSVWVLCARWCAANYREMCGSGQPCQGLKFLADQNDSYLLWQPLVWHTDGRLQICAQR